MNQNIKYPSVVRSMPGCCGLLFIGCTTEGFFMPMKSPKPRFRRSRKNVTRSRAKALFAYILERLAKL